ncbi:MAG TPA: M1 family aminopeptidase, partial [Thermoanaerobaculia bacterium]|nr:M1 family aminopeptidase [Thermoanaerobaculia bacterium]
FGASTNVKWNSPYVVMMCLLMMSLFSTLTTAALVVSSIHRDFELNTDALFFSSPIKRWQYIAGRFLGSFGVAVLVYFGVITAIMLGSIAPWVAKEELGPVTLGPYAFSLFLLVIPNLLFVGAIFFAVAGLTRSLMATYASVVMLFVLYAIAGVYLDKLENQAIAGLLDPFGLNAFSLATRYWTVFQKNTQVVEISGVYLWNRLLWLAVSAVAMVVTFVFFSFTTGTRKSRKKKPGEADEVPPAERVALPLPRVEQRFSRAGSWSQFRAAVKMEAAATLKSIPFIVMLFFGVFNTWGASDNDSLFGTSAYPVTADMVRAIWGGFSIFALLIAAFYAGDIVWRERTMKLSEVSDAMPVPTWVQWSAKLLSLVLIVFATLAAAVVTTIVIQTARGYTNYELLVYAKGVFGPVATWLALMAGFAFLLQIFFNHKMAGFLGMMLWFVLNSALPALDFEHLLYRFAAIPTPQYSDMNGYGHFVKPIFWLTVYWILFAALMLAVAHLFWVRGTEKGLRQRLQIARQRFSRPVAAVMAALFAAFASTGCYIYYNTNVLNTYRTSKDREKLQAAAETKYKKYEGLAQPRIVDVKADVAIYPERRAVTIDGTYRAINKSGAPIGELHLTWAPLTLTTAEFSIPDAKLKTDDSESGYRIYELAQPLAPGDALTMTFRTGFEAKGFPNGESNTNVVANGTFINNFDYFPHFGYSTRVELQDKNERRKQGLPPLERLKPPHDMKARQEHQLARGTDWLNLDTTVSTSADQIAIAPGYLQREWTANGRRHFHYKTTSPILGFWAYLSARYEVKRVQWNGVPIEIYYDAKHPYNVDRMIYGVQKSLDYFTKHFSPYQHKQARILEFPRYARFAQSFPNTIPYSEAIGFIADLRDEDELDYVFYVTAHEIAHQWWAHQVIGGNVQGSTMITETLSQYSALMVMEKEYGKEAMQRFLRYELDQYLRDRGSETIAEMPLVLVENQGYIHYRKGSLVMYALRDYIGEDAVNRALAKFIEDHGFSGPPYTAATELVKYFRAEAKPEHQELITDLFERITLYDNSTREATVTKRPDGKYAVKFTVASKKLRSDDKGEEKPVPLNEWIDIGVFAQGKKDALGKPLFVEKRRITRPEETFEIIVGEKPAKVGIDPFNKLIDRDPKDNVKTL